MGQSETMAETVRIRPRRLRWLSVVSAIAANAIDWPAYSEAEDEILEPATDVIRVAPDEILAVASAPSIDISASLLPRLSNLMSDIPADSTGLPVVLPGLSDLRAADSAQVSGFGEQLSILKVDRIPLKISGVPPRYPHWARRAGLEAIVTLRFVVTAEGVVRDIKVHKIEGDERFGDEAVRAVGSWRFDPAIKGGKAVACWCFQKVSFKIVD